MAPLRSFYQKIKDDPPKIKEHRIFCNDKWTDSFLFPTFVLLIEEKPSHIIILANSGDSKTCLSGILELEDKDDEAYLVFFSLTKVNSKEVNMLIESAYCVNKNDHHKAKRLLEPSKKNDAKPFIIVLKNVMEGRKPLDSKKQNGRAYKRKKKSQRP